jgi:hypothetical protein
MRPDSPLLQRLGSGRTLLAAAGLGLVAVALSWAGGSWVASTLEEKLTRRLAGSPFQVTWQQLDVGVLGHVTVRDLRMGEGPSTLLQVRAIEADLAWFDLLRGRVRLNDVALDRPAVLVEVRDGKPDAWQRLRKALRKAKDDTDDDGEAPALDRLASRVTVHDGSLQVRAVGKGAGLLPGGFTVQALEGTLDLSDVEGQMSGRFAGAGGQGVLRAEMTEEADQPAVTARFEPPLDLGVPSVDARMPGLRLKILGASLDALGPAVRGIEVAGVGLHASVGRVGYRKGALQVETMALAVEPGVWTRFAPKVAPPPATKGKPPRLPWNPGTLGPLAVQVASVVIRSERTAVGAQATATDLQATLGGARAGIATVTLTAPDLQQLADPDGWRLLEVAKPALVVPRDSLLLRQVPDLGPRIDKLAVLRPDTAKAALAAAEAAAKAAAEEEDVEEAPVGGRVNARKSSTLKDNIKTPAATTKNKPKAIVRVATTPRGVPVLRQRPAMGWIDQLRKAQSTLLATHGRLEKLWPLERVPGELEIRLSGGLLHVVDAHNRPLLGLADAHLVVGPAGPDGRPFEGSVRPFDAAGSWGQLNALWCRHPLTREHRLEVHIAGAGMAQVAASRVPGMSLGEQADFDLTATILAPDARHFDVTGQLSAEHMGIHWWRLADRPIADFQFALPFELSARASPASLTFATPEIRLGDAWMHAEAEVARLDSNPRVHLSVGAPMQDCGAMLHAIPASMLPTIGRIDAHGTMDWSASLAVQLPQTGAVSVDLALGDTLCTVDKFGNLDLQELNGDFDRPVNEDGTLLDDVHIGPGSGSWTPLTAIPVWVTYAMWSSEDSFFKHRGISESLLEKALGIDLSTGRFVYGGSTITQQLAKNLFLRRGKALSRKFEEMLISWQLEKVLGKRRILEIYLNAVEFGPKIYGITRGAWAFYSKTPQQMTPAEGVYMAIIKPSPRSGWGTMRGNGWGDWYAEKCGKYMTKLLTDGTISQEAFDASANAELPFKPGFNPPAGDKK